MEYAAIYRGPINGIITDYWGAILDVFPYDRRDRKVIWRARMPEGVDENRLHHLRALVKNVAKEVMERNMKPSEISTRLTTQRGFVNPELII